MIRLGHVFSHNLVVCLPLPSETEDAEKESQHSFSTPGSLTTSEPLTILGTDYPGPLTTQGH